MTRPDLAPLEPDAFLRWCWETGPRKPGTSPHTVGDLAFMYAGLDPEITYGMVHHWQIRVAVRVRRNQRLGRNPWEGLGG